MCVVRMTTGEKSPRGSSASSASSPFSAWSLSLSLSWLVSLEEEENAQGAGVLGDDHAGEIIR